MQILVKTLLGDTTTLEVTPSDTISQLKSLIETKTGTHADQQKLMYNKVELLDYSRTLEESKIKEDDTVFLFKKRMQIQVLTPEDEMVPIEVDDSTTVASIKTKLEGAVKIPIMYQRLFLGKVELQDLSKVLDLQLHYNSVFFFIPLEEVEVSVVTPTGITKELKLGTSTTVLKMKELLKDTGIHPIHQKLYLDSKVLSDDMTLSESRMPNESTLYLIEKKTNDIGSIKVKYGDEVTDMNVEDAMTFEEVKQEIMRYTQKYLGRPLTVRNSTAIKLILPGNVVAIDEKNLKESGIVKESIIDVEVDVPQRGMTPQLAAQLVMANQVIHTRQFQPRNTRQLQPRHTRQAGQQAQDLALAQFYRLNTHR